MRTARVVVVSVLALAGAACGAAKSRQAPISPTAEAYGGGGGDYAPASASEPSASYGGESARAPAPDERPGLGTEFGEQRTSRVRERRFDRSSDHPFARVALHYNDRDGVMAQANWRGGPDPGPLYAYTPQGGLSIALVGEDGDILPGLSAGGRSLVVGQDGERYEIVVRNQTGGRFEVVASVDGLDVVDGRPADLAKRGYLIEPWGTLVIEGFRTSGDTVAAFRFGAVADSYAALTSGDRNVGVIGFAFFAERGSPWTADEVGRRETADPFPGDPRYSQPPGW